MIVLRQITRWVFTQAQYDEYRAALDRNGEFRVDWAGLETTGVTEVVVTCAWGEHHIRYELTHGEGEKHPPGPCHVLRPERATVTADAVPSSGEAQ